MMVPPIQLADLDDFIAPSGSEALSLMERILQKACSPCDHELRKVSPPGAP